MKPFNNNKAKISAFTLLEMICAMFIFVSIMLILGTGMFTIQQSLESVSSKSNSLLSLQVLENVFTSSIRNAVPFQWPDQTNTNRSIFIGESHRVSFAYLHRVIDSNDGGIRFIQFYLKGDKLMAVYKKVPILPWDISTLNFAEEEVLAQKVASINITYASMINDQIIWQNGWNTQNNLNIPLAIQISVQWQDGTSEQWLRRTAGSGQFESLGARNSQVGGAYD